MKSGVVSPVSDGKTPHMLFMMPPVLLLHKSLGQTPLACIRAFQVAHPEYADIPLGYAGRLDPMAEGLLLVLLGEENKKRTSYEMLPKTYEATMLIGFSTDSYDLLGLVTKSASEPINISHKHLQQTLTTLTGTYMQPYPPYSAARIGGKPLFWWARAGKLAEITIPKKHITIDEITLGEIETVSPRVLEQDIDAKLCIVTGEFRQNHIRDRWTDTLRSYPHTCQLVHMTIDCSHGTYIRGLIHEIGQKLGVPTCTYSLIRTRIGQYTSGASIDPPIHSSNVGGV